MDICSHIGTSVCEGSFHELSVGSPESTCCVAEDLSLNGLEICLTELLNIQDHQKLVSDSIPRSGKNRIEEENKFEEPHQSNLNILTSAETLDGKIGKEPKDANELLAQTGHANSIMPPCSVPLVSALKGSRKKRGIPPQKLTVTWAPDVYDPLPTSVSHLLTSRNQKHRNDTKKKSRNKHKDKGSNGKSSRSIRSKEKKQIRKYSVTPSYNRFFMSLDDYETEVEPNGPTPDFADFSPDPYCGGSFLKKNVTKLHFSVAEAT